MDEHQIREAHEMVGRIAAANVPNIASFCRCGRAYFGRHAGEADDRYREHLRTEITLAEARWLEREAP